MYGLGGYGGGYGGYSGGNGSYGGSYGGYGSSYGGIDSNRSYLNQNRTKITAETNQKEGPDGKKVAVSQQQKQLLQQANGRKVVFEQWFKMMGGLRSIIQLGFAAIALTNFCTTTADLLKKFAQYSKQTSISVAKYIQSKFPTKIFSKLASPQHRGKMIKKIIIAMFRIFAMMLLAFGIKLRREIKNEAQKRQNQMIQKFQKLKQSEIQMEDQRQIERRRLEAEQNANHDANL